VNRTSAVVALSVVGGVAIALLYLSYGVVAVIVLLIALLAASRLDRPALAIGAQLFGVGATIAWLVLPWTIRCAGMGAPTGTCMASPGGAAWLFIGLAIAAAGAFIATRSAAT
jgi:hypothetical protein